MIKKRWFAYAWLQWKPPYKSAISYGHPNWTIAGHDSWFLIFNHGYEVLLQTSFKLVKERILLSICQNDMIWLHDKSQFTVFFFLTKNWKETLEHRSVRNFASIVASISKLWIRNSEYENTEDCIAPLSRLHSRNQIGAIYYRTWD